MVEESREKDDDEDMIFLIPVETKEDDDEEGWTDQSLSRSTCSNSMPLSTILPFPLALRYRDRVIQIWLWNILHSRNGNIRKVDTSLSLPLLLKKT
ncbi:hypothetical protein NL676_012054 [Syzygium grande]|nr:hypothetical protein NL676_012054 [Syzygium grande]